MKKLTIFITCSGLGHVRRGYESFFRGCYDALHGDPSLDLFLFKGGGESGGRELRLRNLPRASRAARILGRLCGRGPYFSEQLTFLASLLPHLIGRRPDLVYVSDVVLANLLRFAKRGLGLRYKILFNNNGPTLPSFLTRWEHIQQVSPQYMKEALEVGVPADIQTMLPSAITIKKTHAGLDAEARRALRHALGLPSDKRLILSVGAINNSRKRMSYLITEIAASPKPAPFLLIIGAREGESDAIIEQGRRLLGSAGFDARSVEKSEMGNFYAAADLFALASLDEGFGLVYVEALAHGLPCLVHDYETSRFVLGDLGIFGDLSKEGGFVRLLTSLGPRTFHAEEALARHAWAYEHFSWDRLRTAYLDMFVRCANGVQNATRSVRV